MAVTPFNPMFERLSTVMDLRLRQHGLTASNLANADTPGYKAQVLEFDTLLSKVMDGRAERPGGGMSVRVSELEPVPWAPNDNSVDVDREMAKMQANQLMYGAVTRGTSRAMAILKYAATDSR